MPIYESKLVNLIFGRTMDTIFNELVESLNLTNQLMVRREGGNNKSLICQIDGDWEDEIHLSLFDNNKYNIEQQGKFRLTIDSGKMKNTNNLKVLRNYQTNFIDKGFDFKKFDSGFSLKIFPNNNFSEEEKSLIKNAILLLNDIYQEQNYE